MIEFDKEMSTELGNVPLLGSSSTISGLGTEVIDDYISHKNKVFLYISIAMFSRIVKIFLYNLIAFDREISEKLGNVLFAWSSHTVSV